MIRRLMRRMAGRFALAFASDTSFVEQAYRGILGREADQDGLRFYTGVLRDGANRMEVLLSLTRSDEFKRRLSPSVPVRAIRSLRPSSYRSEIDARDGTPVPVFEVRTPADFDWLEAMIVEHGYYERPGVWGLEVDVDKKVMAEMVASLRPQRALELGCASGAILECLDRLGVVAEGVDVSHMAVDRAGPSVKSRIHHGDLLGLELPGPYDAVFGLDVFEHLNPNRLDAYLSRVAALTRPGGYVFANIPAFGEDAVFGTVFPFYVTGWERDRSEGRPFSTLQVDEQGFPIHGHLVWAGSAWWVARFEGQGLRRELDIERAFHRRYDRYFEKRSPARKSFYVFSRSGDPTRSRSIAESIAASPSPVLRDSGA
jgi:hypothetical protein